MFDRHTACLAFDRAFAETGAISLRRIAIIAITTSNSINAKTITYLLFILLIFFSCPLLVILDETFCHSNSSPARYPFHNYIKITSLYCQLDDH